MLPAKAKYLQRDTTRSSERVNRPGLSSPKDLMSMAMTVSPLRALHYIKANFPRSKFLDVTETLFQNMWTPPHVNLTKDGELVGVLAKATDAQGRLLFTENEVKDIMSSRPQMKDVLREKTEEAVKLGAFGAPWLWVTNGEGQAEAFFGSDRYVGLGKRIQSDLSLIFVPDSIIYTGIWESHSRMSPSCLRLSRSYEGPP